MVKTVTYDFRSFCRGELVEKRDTLSKNDILFSSGTGILVAYSQIYPQTIPVGGNIQQAFDPIIVILQNMAYPVAFICIAWACLEAMIGKPASAVSRAKWAIIGYLAMRYVPALLKSI